MKIELIKKTPTNTLSQTKAFVDLPKQNEPEDRNTLPKSFSPLCLAVLIVGLLVILATPLAMGFTVTTFTSTIAIVGYVISGIALLSLTAGIKRLAAQFNKSDQCEVSRDTRTMTPSGDMLGSPDLVNDMTSTNIRSTEQRASRASV